MMTSLVCWWDIKFTPFVEMVPLFSACLQPAQSLREASAAESFGPLGYPTLFEPYTARSQTAVSVSISSSPSSEGSASNDEV